MENKYTELDLNEFFKDEYKKLNYSEGIGASGIITVNQIINVYNDPKIDKKSGIEYLGLGNHIDVLDRLIKDIYNTNSTYLEKYYKELITIKYWNCPYSKIILFFLPELMTELEFNNLCLLEEYYKEIFSKVKIDVGVFTYGSNVREYGPEIQTKSNLKPILEYANKRVSKELKRDNKEKILKI